MVGELRGIGLELDYEGGVRALDGVDAALAPGELVAIVGPNGAGKTSLLRALAGLEEPTAGAVELDGRPLRSLGPRERARRIAVVPQNLRTLPDLRTRDFVAGGRYAHRARFAQVDASEREIVAGALERADLAGAGDRLLARLSGGEQQRALVARALAQEARLLLVDEPTSSLDPEHQVRVFDLIAGLVADGRGVAVVTHELNLAMQFADRVVLLHRGRVAAEGAAEAVLRPEVLDPVYGRHLRFGWLPDERGQRGRAFVLPWREARADGDQPSEPSSTNR